MSTSSESRASRVRSTIRISITRLKLSIDPTAPRPRFPINYKNLDYEIETIICSVIGTDSCTINYKNLDYEIETPYQDLSKHFQTYDQL